MKRFFYRLPIALIIVGSLALLQMQPHGSQQVAALSTSRLPPLVDSTATTTTMPESTTTTSTTTTSPASAKPRFVFTQKWIDYAPFGDPGGCGVRDAAATLDNDGRAFRVVVTSEPPVDATATWQYLDMWGGPTMGTTKLTAGRGETWLCYSDTGRGLILGLRHVAWDGDERNCTENEC